MLKKESSPIRTGCKVGMSCKPCCVAWTERINKGAKIGTGHGGLLSFHYKQKHMSYATTAMEPWTTNTHQSFFELVEGCSDERSFLPWKTPGSYDPLWPNKPFMT